jgi:signal transduction histidine kinase
MRIDSKISVGFFLMAFLVGVVGYFGLRASIKIQEGYDEINPDFHDEVIAGVAASSYAKLAESSLFLFLALGKTEDKEDFFKEHEYLIEQIDILGKAVTTSGGLKQLLNLRSAADDILKYGIQLISEQERAPFSFAAERHELLIKQFHDAASIARESGVSIAQRRTIDAAINVISFAKRAEGHLFLFLFLKDPVDKEKFFMRHQFLLDQIEILETAITSVEGRQLLLALRKESHDILIIGQELLLGYEKNPALFQLINYESQVRQLSAAANRVRELGAHLAQLEASYTKVHSKEAERTARRFQNEIFAVLLFSIVVAIAIALILAGTISKPITKLTRHMAYVGKTGDLSAKIQLNQKDEIGRLAVEYENMVKSLSSMRGKLLEQSYYSGMSEIATGVLHNVNNAFTPLIVSFELLAKNIEGFEYEKLNSIASLLEKENRTSDKGQDLIRYLVLLAKIMSEDSKEAEKALHDVQQQLFVISSILQEHETFVYAERPIEKCYLQEIIEDAVSSAQRKKGDKPQITFDPQVKKLGIVETQRIVLLQILINIIQNAGRAIKKRGIDGGKIHIQGEVEKALGQEYIHLRISDNGIGIAQENIKRIFQLNYSTKKKFSGGFGLHWCANSIAALKGSVYAESDGLDSGACFHLIFPRKHN